MKKPVTRRKLLLGLGLATPALILGGIGLAGKKGAGDALLGSGEWLSLQARQRVGRKALAREYRREDISAVFRPNGSTQPKTPQWVEDAGTGFETWQLQVGGKVKIPRAFSLAELRALPARTQITRHDCVEGWSCIGQWTGVPLATVLGTVGLQSDARYIVFHCADKFGAWMYYESIDLIDAFHPQTILAYEMNGAALPVRHGAPCRLRVERQLGYKHAKFVMQIEAASSLSQFGDGKGGFWEDLSDYAWYAGI